MQFLQKKWDPDVRQDHHPEERRFGARAALGLNFCAQCLRLAVLIRRDEPRIFRPFSASIVLALTMIAPVNLNNQS
jgi:hypothetical protein